MDLCSRDLDFESKPYPCFHANFRAIWINMQRLSTSPAQNNGVENGLYQSDWSITIDDAVISVLFNFIFHLTHWGRDELAAIYRRHF